MNDIYGPMFPPDFWRRMLLFLAGCTIAIFVVNTIFRKLLGVKRRPFFTNNHMSDFHKKADWSLRILAVVFILLTPVFAWENYQLYLLLIPLVFALAQEILTAVMEKKHSENPNDYLFTLIQFPVTLIIMFSLAGGLFPEMASEMLNSIA